MQKHFECDDCGAVFNLTHEMDHDFYKVRVCPFCGEGMSDEENYDLEEPEE